MKTKLNCFFVALVLLALSTLDPQLANVFAQGTAFTYQGRLNSGSGPASGLYDFRFKLYTDPYGNNQVGASYLISGIAVTNGLFTTPIDFGAGIFIGGTNWLEVDVRTNGGGGYTVLNPLQNLTPTPYAIFAETASNLTGTLPASQLSGISGNAVTFNNAGNSFSGNGAGLAGVNAVALNGLSASNFWQTGGNGGTTSGANYLGTSDDQPLELHANGGRALRIEPNAKGAPNLIGGSPNNYVAGGLVGATIGGGGAVNYSGGSYTNSVLSDFGTVGGGYNNIANGYAAVVSGGYNNANYGFAGFIGAGDGNTILGSGSGDGAYLGGGYSNTNGGEAATLVGGTANFIGSYANNAFIGGGGENRIVGSDTLPGFDIIGGGQYNIIQSNATYAIIGGGYKNTNSGSYTFIGGGVGNTVSGYAAVIGGGTGNLASNYWSTVGGGIDNSANGNSATVGGGVFNNASTNYAAIGGGGANSASGSAAFVGGGGIHEVGGGIFYQNGNSASGTASVVVGGLSNVGGGAGSFVGGGGFDGANVSGNAAQAGAATIGGGFGNSISSGGTYAFIGGGITNSATGYYATVAGGAGNNAINGNGATVGGGLANIASGNYTTVGGGYHNSANGDYISLGGGAQNTNSGSYGTLGGGQLNTVSGSYATAPGGFGNIASGPYSFAAGKSAIASQSGAFVWADGLNFLFDPYGQSGPQGVINSFNVRSTGGFYIATGVNGSGTITAGAYLAANSTSWSTLSDRNAKKDFAPVDYQAVLTKLANMPVEHWHYKWEKETDVPNLGPMAQDFKGAFYPGRDDKSITTLEFDGVELAAIKGLNQKLEAESKAQDDEIRRLEQSVAQLRVMVVQLARSQPH